MNKNKYKCPFMESKENYAGLCPYYMAPTMLHQSFLDENQFHEPNLICLVEAETAEDAQSLKAKV